MANTESVTLDRAAVAELHAAVGEAESVLFLAGLLVPDDRRVVREFGERANEEAQP